MDQAENTKPTMSSLLRPPTKTHLPMPQPKISLNEMSESQSNVRATGLPLPASSSLKHKATDCNTISNQDQVSHDPNALTVVEPPSKQRKVGATQTGMQRPSSALGLNRMAASTNGIRPPSRTMHATSQSMSSRGPLSASSRPTTSIHTNRPQGLKGHGRSKSQYTSLRPPAIKAVKADEDGNEPSEWVAETKINAMEGLMNYMKATMEGTTFERNHMKEMVEAMRSRILELESYREKQEVILSNLRIDHDNLKIQAHEMTFEADRIRRTMDIEIEDIKRKHCHEVDDMRENHRKDVERLTQVATSHDESTRKEARDELERMRRDHVEELSSLISLHKAELEKEHEIRVRDIEEISRQRDLQIDKIASTIGNKEREADQVRDELQRRISELNQQTTDIERERSLRQSLEAQLQQKLVEIEALNGANQAVKAQVEFLQSNNQQQSSAFATLHKQTQDAIAARDEAVSKLRAEETLRRKLHNQVQELKGNIRVFCRVRPLLDEPIDESAKLRYPDEAEESKEVVVFGMEQKSSLGTVSRPQHAFAFDRVFGPASNNGEIFDEISQLIQSALDGYNVCIFCYGQTGSGKTHTMSSADGMIPRAVRQIYGWAKALEEKGWKYTMAGSFVEVYNENLNDLLGKAEEFDKKKHEIRHDPEKLKTTITGVKVVPLNSPEAVEGILNQADQNRSVAATKANQRSSRSHSVFILTLVGVNEISGERSEGTLNLVDLAGSERLAHSQAEGQRLKETQNINKSLSCLGDVIGALGRGDSGHIPYRNSKLTYLLQYSLGGNSKTLMFVMISPLQAHISETLTSLKFATKVHNTHIGTAKRQNRVT